MTNAANLPVPATSSTRTASARPFAHRHRRAAMLTVAALSATTFAVSLAHPASAATPLCFGKPATIVGTKNSETINGTAGDDVIVGLGGNDVIHGLGGNDRICGGSGADDLYGGSGNDRLKGGSADDELYGEGDDDILRLGGYLDGGEGNDDMTGTGASTLGYRTATTGVQVRLDQGTAFGQGIDTFTGAVSVYGSDLDDIIYFSSASNFANTFGGKDVIEQAGVNPVGGAYDTVQLGEGDDKVRMLTNQVVVNGEAGLDTIDLFGLGFNAQTINLNLGTIAGFQRLTSVEGVLGTAGNDVINGSRGHDVIDGKGGNDQINGSCGDDTLLGGVGDDTIYGGADCLVIGLPVVAGGNDTLDGGADDDKLYGGNGNDVLTDKIDQIFAGELDADQLFGEDGNDTIDADDGIIGNDKVDGGNDTDSCTLNLNDLRTSCETFVIK